MEERILHMTMICGKSISISAIAAAALFGAATSSEAAVYRQGTTFVYGTLNEEDPASSTIVPTSSTLAFAGVTLDDLANHVFCAWEGGNAIGRPVYALGKHTAYHRNANGDIDKIVTQFSMCDDTGPNNMHTKAVVIELVNGSGGVFARKLAARYYNNKDAPMHAFFSMDANGTVKYNQGSGGYNVYALRAFPGFLGASPSRLWTRADGVLTLDDVKDAAFTARAGGNAIASGNLATGLERIRAYNKRVVINGEGRIDAIRLEFQFLEGTNLKALLVELTNGEDGVYGAVKASRYISPGMDKTGYRFWNDDGTYNGSNYSIATSPVAGGYGVFDVQAEVEDESVTWTLDSDKKWSDFTGGAPLDNAGLAVHIVVAGENPSFAFDESARVAKVVFENGLASGVASNSVSVSGSPALEIGSLEIGDGVHSALPPAFPATVTLGVGARAIYSGNVRVVHAITGAGSVEAVGGAVEFASRKNAFLGGLYVKPGAVAVAGAAPLLLSQATGRGPFGLFMYANAVGGVHVEEGGRVDVNGINGLSYAFCLAGNGAQTGEAGQGALVNSGAALNMGEYGDMTLKAQAWGIVLEGDAAIGGGGQDAGLTSLNYNNAYLYGCTLGLGAHTLAKKGDGVLWLWSKALTASGTGTLSIEGGAVDVRYGAYTGTSSKVVVGAGGALRLGAGMKVSRLENNGTVEIVGDSSFDVLAGDTSKTWYAATVGTGIFGDGSIVKSGTGTVSVPFNNNSKRVCTVDKGVLKANRPVILATGNAYALNTAAQPHANQRVEVAAGAAYDLNGTPNVTAHVTLAKGAKIMNSGADITTDSMQTVQLTLEGDAEAVATGRFGLIAPSYKEARLELGGNTLTFTGTNFFWLVSATITGTGTLAVSNGFLQAHRLYNTEGDVTGDECTLVIGERGAFLIKNASKTCRFRNFENKGSVMGDGTLTVTGTLAAGNGIPRLALTDGATLKAKGPQAAPQTVTTEFSAAGEIAVDVEAVPREVTLNGGRVPLFTAPSFPAGFQWKLRDPQPGRRLVTVQEASGTTLYLSGQVGAVIFLR